MLQIINTGNQGRSAGSEIRMWVYRSGELEPNPVILYEYQKTRKKEHAREFLKDFSGICVTDGYQVYHSIAEEREDLAIAGCWSHARRGFADVVKAAGKKDLNIRESIAFAPLTVSIWNQLFLPTVNGRILRSAAFLVIVT